MDSSMVKPKYCFCGADNVVIGCDTWCGTPEAYKEEIQCAETLTWSWEPWGTCNPMKLKAVSRENLT